jgi:hypothetical protein
MPKHAQLYIAWVLAAGSMLLVAAFAHWGCADPVRFATYLLLALVAGTLKIRLPGLSGTYSLTFLFVLIGIADLTFAETVAIACSSMIVQSLWRPVERTTRAQVAFNAAASAISVAVSFLTAQLIPSLGLGRLLALQVLLAAGVYYAINTLLVSVVVALVDQKPVLEVWSQWFEWCLRYYLAGVATAGVIIACNHYLGWAYSLLMLPVMYAEYFGVRIAIGSQFRKTLSSGPAGQP